MNIKKLLGEQDLEIDDVRWYCSALLAERLLHYRDRKHELIRYLWSGALEEEMYEMEEEFLRRLQEDHERGLIDNARVREIIQEIAAARSDRYGEALD